MVAAVVGIVLLVCVLALFYRGWDIAREIRLIEEAGEPFFDFDPADPWGENNRVARYPNDDAVLNLAPIMVSFDEQIPRFEVSSSNNFASPSYVHSGMEYLLSSNQLPSEVEWAEFVRSNALARATMEPLLMEREDLYLSPTKRGDFVLNNEVFSPMSRLLEVEYLHAVLSGDASLAVQRFVDRQIFRKNISRFTEEWVRLSVRWYFESGKLDRLLSHVDLTNEQLDRLAGSVRIPSQDDLIYELYFQRQAMNNYLCWRKYKKMSLSQAGVTDREYSLYPPDQQKIKNWMAPRIFDLNRLIYLRYYREALEVARTAELEELQDAFLALCLKYSDSGYDAVYVNSQFEVELLQKDPSGCSHYLAEVEEAYIHLLAIELERWRLVHGVYPADLAGVPCEGLAFIQDVRGVKYRLTTQGYEMYRVVKRFDGQVVELVVFEIERK